MTLEQLETEVLALPQDSLLELFARILEQLAKTNDMDQAILNEWIEEAETRDQDLISGEVVGYSASQVFSDLRASL
jgi:hypothetical protein